ncbi:MAG: hypothetical protein F9K32_05625 [Desulfobulbaceae bacterium]|nr:MAG: hypothetical protein F9K32_05625 [Desulfobulbaceae bacterium]
MRSLVQILVCTSLLLAGCEASFNLTTAGLSDPAVSTAVDLNTGAPLEKATIFPADVKTLYATVQLKNGPADTSVRAVFYYLEGKRQQIAEDTVKGEGSRHLSFSLNPPETGWPAGRYEVEFALNGEVKEKTGFAIVPTADMPVAKSFPSAGGQQATPPAQPAQTPPSPPAQPAQTPPETVPPPAAQPGAAAPGVPAVPPATPPPTPARAYKTFQDKQFGFSFELPDSWTFQTVGANSDYLFSGQPGTPEAEISVIVQIVDTQKGVVGSLKDQMLSLLNQFSQMAGAKIESKSQIQTANQMAPFFLVTYQAENTRKQQVTFGHTQLGIDHPPYLLLISYSAPREIYQRNVAVFQHMVESLKLTPPVR